jgi:hypothetical protein
MDDIEILLARDTDQWTKPFVHRAYPASNTGQSTAEQEAVRLFAHEYVPMGDSVVTQGDSHINLRRTVARTVMTGGLGLLLFGASRSEERALMTASWMLLGKPFQPREVVLYLPGGASGVKIGDVAIKRSGFMNVHHEMTGTAANGGKVNIEKAEIEASLYRLPDLTRIEVGRVIVEGLLIGASRPWQVKFSGNHPYNLTATTMAVVRRVLPANGIWQEAQPVRRLWADIFPNSANR